MDEIPSVTTVTVMDIPGGFRAGDTVWIDDGVSPGPARVLSVKRHGPTASIHIGRYRWWHRAGAWLRGAHYRAKRLGWATYDRIVPDDEG